jgi:hypothetical protein
MLRGSVSQIRAAIRFISNPAFLAPALSFDCRTSLQSIHQPYKEPGLKNETGTCHASSTWYTWLAKKTIDLQLQLLRVQNVSVTVTCGCCRASALIRPHVVSKTKRASKI